MTARTSTDGATAKGANVCYAVEAVHTRSGNPSHHSAPVCAHAGQTIGTAVRDIRIVRSGACALQLLYRNTADQINLGITGRVTWLAVQDRTGQEVAGGVVKMPHSPKNAEPSYSTPLHVNLNPENYQFELRDFYNMSDLQSNATYGDAGGVKETLNRVDLHGVRIMQAPSAVDTHSAAPYQE